MPPTATTGLDSDAATMDDCELAGGVADPAAAPTSTRGTAVDLNADLGEGFGPWRMGDDEALLAIVTSANVACGFHAGDPTIMQRTCERAVSKGVRIGAHIGHRDLVVDPGEITDQALYQIGALDAAARAAGDRVRYVKPHGALYHSASSDGRIAAAVLRALRLFDSRVALLGPPGSALEVTAADHGVPFVAEAFADRAYTASGALTPRSTSGAMLDCPAAVAQALSLATSGTARVAESGEWVAVAARSICVHGDSPGAVAIARSIRTALIDRGITISPFT